MDAPPLMTQPAGNAALTEQLVGPVWRPMSRRGARRWWLLLGTAALGTGLLLVAVTATVVEGVGLWGNNIPVAWAFAITNFVWWIGIGHAGTFISAILLLFEQGWRTTINRFAEAMTLFAVMQAGLFPLLHLGRPWFFYWLIPYPATMQVWPNFKSALPWDAAAVFTYFTISLLFFYLGLVPDLAIVRDRSPRRWQRWVYGVLALGWRGAASHQRHYRVAYGLMAGLATPLVLSVHSVVASDFAITLLPGWHSTIFPPYFVAGAIFSGFAMVTTLMVPIRKVFGWQNVITLRHVDNVAKLTLVTAWVVIYSYMCEFGIAWLSGDRYEIYAHSRGFFASWNSWVYWLTLLCNVAVPQLYWFRSVRRTPLATLLVALLINVGMWSERFSIIVLALQRDFLPSSWFPFHPTLVDWSIFVGTLGFFGFLYLLFLRFVPVVPTSEAKELAHRLGLQGLHREGGK
jgi:Ni/Fe-hydrogenase subunit HybB-like protein